MPTKSHLRVGVFIPYGAQFLDVSPVDLFGMLDPAYLEIAGFPQSLVTLGVPSTIYYIGLSDNTEKRIDLTANANLTLNRTTADKDVQPGQLDILLIPGPDPNVEVGEETRKFIKAHANAMDVDVLSVCTGCFLLVESGACKGKKASAPRALVGELKKKYPDTEWDNSHRWVQDGNIWSSGGVTNGQEMVAAYMRDKFPGPAAEAVIAMADVGEKGNEYTSHAKLEALWWFWQIIRSVMLGFRKK